jgi:Glu-tRNA(Gln) amidotransferase subunit E-like FAD-binding protein
LIRRGGADIVDTLVDKTGADGLIAAIEIGQRTKALRRAGIPVERLGTGEWVEVFDLFTDGRIPREAIPVVASRMATDRLNARAAAGAEGVTVLGRERWQSELDALNTHGYYADRGDNREKRLRFLAGRAMQKLKYKASAKEMVDYLRLAIEEVAK